MRLGGRLLLQCRKELPEATLNHLISVDHFHDVMAATQACSFSTAANSSMPDTPLKMRHLVSNLIKKKRDVAIKNKDQETVEEMCKLKELCRSKCGDRVSQSCHFSVKDRG